MANRPAELWRQRQLLRQLTNRAVQQRFRGSALGLLWAMLNPVFMLLVYTFVFSFVLRIRSWNGQGTSFVFAMNLFCGLIVYGIFAESVGAASIQVLSNPSYVKKILFPLEILPLAGLGAAIIFNLFGLAVLLVCTQFFLSPLSIHAIALPIVWIPLFLLTAGLSWIVGALGVFAARYRAVDHHHPSSRVLSLPDHLSAIGDADAAADPVAAIVFVAESAGGIGGGDPAGIVAALLADVDVDAAQLRDFPAGVHFRILCFHEGQARICGCHLTANRPWTRGWCFPCGGSGSATRFMRIRVIGCCNRCWGVGGNCTTNSGHARCEL